MNPQPPPYPQHCPQQGYPPHSNGHQPPPPDYQDYYGGQGDPYRRQPEQDYYSQPGERHGAASIQQPRQAAPARQMRNGLGTAGFVLGLVGLVFSFIPIIGVIAWPLVIGGLILGIVGFNRARDGGANNQGLALTGIILSSIGLIVCLLYALIFSAAVAGSTPTSAGGLSAPAPAGDSGPHKFGEVVTVGSVAYSVSKPIAYTPSSSAAVMGGDIARAVKQNITITNNGTAPYAFNPFSVSPTATAGGNPAPTITDISNGIGAANASTILPGKSLTYAVAFSVPPTSGDYQVELSSSLFGSPVVFAGTS